MASVNETEKWIRIHAAFDTVTGACYYGFSFKSVLADNPQALEALETVARCLKEAKATGAE
jgi:hypothetical protein